MAWLLRGESLSSSSFSADLKALNFFFLLMKNVTATTSHSNKRSPMTRDQKHKTTIKALSQHQRSIAVSGALAEGP